MPRRPLPDPPRFDPGAKWLLSQEPLDAMRYLAGLTNILECQAIETESLVFRRTPDRLFEVTVSDSPQKSLILVEVSAEPYKDLALQMEDLILTVRLAHGITPDALSIVLRPYSSDRFRESRSETSLLGLTTVETSWKMIQMWDLDAEDLVSAGVPALLPWTVLARREVPLEDWLERVRGLAEQWVPQTKNREQLLLVTAMFAKPELGDDALEVLFGSATTWEVLMKTGVFKDTIGEWLAEAEARGRAVGEAQGAARGEAKKVREIIVRILKSRFGPDASGFGESVNRVQSMDVLDQLCETASLCGSLEEFRARLESLR